MTPSGLRSCGAPAASSFPTNFKDYPGGVESFDVYHGPITTQYSQVWWASTSNPLPDDIVRRFDGSADWRAGAAAESEDGATPPSSARRCFSPSRSR